MLDIVKAMKLSNRLQYIYESLLPAMPVWDFCCDHGYLGVAALKSGKFPQVCFVDQVPHIIQKIESVVSKKFPEHRTRAHFFANPAEDVVEVIRGSVVIAGVGAFAIFKILHALEQRKIMQAQRLILCPQRDEEKFLLMLRELGEDFNSRFSLTSATLLVERDRSRVVYVMDRADTEWTQALE